MWNSKPVRHRDTQTGKPMFLSCLTRLRGTLNQRVDVRTLRHIKDGRLWHSLGACYMLGTAQGP